MGKAKTLAQIAEIKGVHPDSLKKKLRRATMAIPDTDEELSPEIIDFLTTDRRGGPNAATSPKTRTRHPKKRKNRDKGLKKLFSALSSIDIKSVLPILPLPTLGLAASWGVFHFSAHFVPVAVAVIECAGFEAVYIGLAISKGLNSDLKKRVTRVSLAAVTVSVIYNAISAAMWAKTGGAMAESIQIVQSLNPWLFWTLAILHGGPLAVLSYFVANLVIHQKK